MNAITRVKTWGHSLAVRMTVQYQPAKHTFSTA